MANPVSYSEVIARLRNQNVPTFSPGEREYVLSTATTNLVYRFTRPDCVVQPRNSYDVRIVVTEAARYGIKLTIKSGGHSYAGFSTTDEGILIDLKRMKSVRLHLDAAGNPTHVDIEMGALWGDVYRTLIYGRHDGYIINGGRCPSVGVGGFILGGGLGPFTRSFGMGCDTVTSLTIVTASGRQRTVTANDVGEGRDLFRALLGAGGGNFGVVVDVTMNVRRLTGGNQNLAGITTGFYTWYPRSTASPDFLAIMNAVLSADWDDALTMDIKWLRATESSSGGGGAGKLGIVFRTYFDGHTRAFDALIESVLPRSEDNLLVADLKKELTRRRRFERSTLFLHESLALMWNDEARSFLPGASESAYQLFSSYVYDAGSFAGGELVRTVLELQADFALRFEGDGCNFGKVFIHAGGAAGRVREDMTAFPWRGARYHADLDVTWKDKWLEGDVRDWFEDATRKLRPFAVDGTAAYVNFGDVTLRAGNLYERAYFGNNVPWLKDVKRAWDPNNIFRGDQTINADVLAEASPRALPEGEEGEARETDYVLLSGTKSESGNGSTYLGMTDDVAAKGWETFPLPPPGNYVDIY